MTDHRRLALGYATYLLATLLFAINGTVVKSLLVDDMDAPHLSEIRSAGAFLVLFIVVLLTNRRALVIRRDEWLLLAAYGMIGVFLTQFLYFISLQRLQIGVALIIEFTAPIMVALWIRFGRGQYVRPTVWLGLGLALFGLALIAQVWKGMVLDGVGVLAAFGAAAALALFYLIAEKSRGGSHPRDAISLMMWGLGGATLLWSVIQPWWLFPWATIIHGTTPLGGTGPEMPVSALVAWMILFGTAIPFTLAAQSLGILSASQASIAGMTEPVLASLIAWIVLGEILGPLQMLGGLVVLAGVYVAERSR